MHHPKPSVTIGVSDEAGSDNGSINNFLKNLAAISHMVDPLAATRLSNVTTAPEKVIQATQR